MTRSSVDLTLPLSQLLQGPAIAIADATHLMESLKSLICCKAIPFIPFIKDVTVISLNLFTT